MSGSSPTSLKPLSGPCPFCGFEYLGSPTQCKRCGTLQERARDEIRAKGREARRHLHFQRAYSDLFFLVGLLLGGPMMTLGGETRLGLLLILAGGFASVLRRYTEWSTPGTVGVGVLSATLVATVLVGSEAEADETAHAGADAREAYAQALGQEDGDVMVETRGMDAVTIWFHPPQDTVGECGTFPIPAVREHLRELGFKRVVVVARARTGGICSFPP